MTIQDLKIYAINSIALAISFTEIEMMLKIVLLLVTIGYSIHKWYEMARKNK